MHHTTPALPSRFSVPDVVHPTVQKSPPQEHCIPYIFYAGLYRTFNTNLISLFFRHSRVDTPITWCASHRSGCAAFLHPDLYGTYYSTSIHICSRIFSFSLVDISLYACPKIHSIGNFFSDFFRSSRRTGSSLLCIYGFGKRRRVWGYGVYTVAPTRVAVGL